MTFEQYEESQFDGEPIQLYRFIYGPQNTDAYGYTDAEQAVFISSHEITYQPVPIDRDAISASGKLDNTTLAISMPARLEVPQMWVGYPPATVVEVYIYQMHLSDPDKEFKQIWAGRALTVGWSGTGSTLSCEPFSTSQRRVGLRRNFQYMCPLMLYQTGLGQCNADLAAATTTTQLVSTVARTMLVSGTFPDNTAYLSGGQLRWTLPNGQQEIRTIIAIETVGANTQVTLSGIIRDINVGDDVLVIKGCNHSEDHCTNQHANINNYGGDLWIPIATPFGSVSPYI